MRKFISKNAIALFTIIISFVMVVLTAKGSFTDVFNETLGEMAFCVLWFMGMALGFLSLESVKNDES